MIGRPFPSASAREAKLWLSRNQKRELQGEVYDIARATVLEHLKRGCMPDDRQWNIIFLDYVPTTKAPPFTKTPKTDPFHDNVTLR